MARRTMLLAACALVAAACGSGEAEETTTSLLPAVTTTAAGEVSTTTTTGPTTTTTESGEAASSAQLASIRAAIAQSAEITSARMEGRIEVTGSVDGGPTMDLAIPFGGSFDTATGNSSFFMDMSGMADMAGMSGTGGEEIPPELVDMFGEMEVRVVDGTSYIKFPFFSMLFGAETPWISAPEEEGSSLTGDFTFSQPDNPAELLREFEDADAAVTEIGRETVNGVETTHYRAVFDAAAMLDEASPEEREKLLQDGRIPDGEFPVDLWISDDGVVVRYVMEVDGSQVESEEGQSFDRMVMTFDLYDLNQPVTIVAPDPSEVTDVESLGGAMFGLPGS